MPCCWICSVLTIFASHFSDHNLRERKKSIQFTILYKSRSFFFSFNYKYVHLLVHVQFICLINKILLPQLIMNVFFTDSFFCLWACLCGISRLIPAKNLESKCIESWKKRERMKRKKQIGAHFPLLNTPFSVQWNVFGFSVCVRGSVVCIMCTFFVLVDFVFLSLDACTRICT